MDNDYFQKYTDETRDNIIKFLELYSYTDDSHEHITSDVRVVPMFRVKDILRMAQVGQYCYCGG